MSLKLKVRSKENVVIDFGSLSGTTQRAHKSMLVEEIINLKNSNHFVCMGTQMQKFWLMFDIYCQKRQIEGKYNSLMQSKVNKDFRH